MDSHNPSKGFWFTADHDWLAAANADISEDPQVDAAGQDNSQAQQQEADEGLRTHTEQHDEGGVDGVIAGFLGSAEVQNQQQTDEDLYSSGHLRGLFKNKT